MMHACMYKYIYMCTYILIYLLSQMAKVTKLMEAKIFYKEHRRKICVLNLMIKFLVVKAK